MTELILGLVLTYILLCIGEAIGFPKAATCDCPMMPRLIHHYGSTGQFFFGLIPSVLSILGAVSWHKTIDRVSIFFWVYLAVFGFFIWWKHSKNGRKKFLGKILGRVTITVAGLKVVPE